MRLTTTIGVWAPTSLVMLALTILVGQAWAETKPDSEEFEYVRIEGLGTWHAHPQPTAIREGSKTFIGSSDEKEWTTRDGGRSWKKVWGSNDGVVSGYEPHAKRGQALSPRNHDGEELSLLWWAGKHDRFFNFDVAIKTRNGVASDIKARADEKETPVAVAERVADHYMATQTPAITTRTSSPFTA